MMCLVFTQSKTTKGGGGGGWYCMILCNKILVWVHQEQASFLCLATMRFIS